MISRHSRFSPGCFRYGATFGLLLALGMLWGVMAGPATAQRNVPRFENSTLTVLTRAGAAHKFRIEIARTPEQLAVGLMYRRRLAADSGMLFLHRRVEPARMWMKNTYIPLDMLFVAADGSIVGIKQRTVPLSLAVIASKKPVMAVFEVNAGTVSRLGIGVGDRLEHAAFGAPK